MPFVDDGALQLDFWPENKVKESCLPLEFLGSCVGTWADLGAGSPLNFESTGAYL